MRRPNPILPTRRIFRRRANPSLVHSSHFAPTEPKPVDRAIFLTEFGERGTPKTRCYRWRDFTRNARIRKGDGDRRVRHRDLSRSSRGYATDGSPGGFRPRKPHELGHRIPVGRLLIEFRRNPGELPRDERIISSHAITYAHCPIRGGHGLAHASRATFSLINFNSLI